MTSELQPTASTMKAQDWFGIAVRLGACYLLYVAFDELVFAFSLRLNWSTQSQGYATSSPEGYLLFVIAHAGLGLLLLANIRTVIRLAYPVHEPKSNDQLSP